MSFLTGSALDVCIEHFSSNSPPDVKFRNAQQALESHCLKVNEKHNTMDITRMVFELDDSYSATHLIQTMNVLNSLLEKVNPASKLNETILLGFLGYKIRRDIYKVVMSDLHNPDSNYLDICNKLRRVDERRLTRRR